MPQRSYGWVPRVLGAALVFATGCALPQRKVVVHDLEAKQRLVVSFPASLRGTFISDKNAQIRFCAEPAPDVALESLEKITANLKAATQTAETAEGTVSTELGAKVVQLAGRTQVVLIAREMLYRACELSLNQTIDPNTALQMYKTVATLVERLGTVEGDQAKAQHRAGSGSGRRGSCPRPRRCCPDATPRHLVQTEW